jgi:G:T-mismatch repair DNA endonuclease (very short patch repair protein)
MGGPTVVVAAYNTAAFPEGGGHFWVYLQYVLGLRALGCDVYWLEAFRRNGRPEREAAALATFRERIQRFGLADKSIVYVTDATMPSEGPTEYLGWDRAEAEAVFQRADLLLNFHYAIHPALLARFRTTALVDIDPGLLQFWMTRGQLSVSQHDVYFTIGENVGKPGGRIPDCGHTWVSIRPPVSLDHWKYRFDPDCEAFTTVSIWDSSDWIVDGEVEYENTKRVAFLEYADLPRMTQQPLELALFLTHERDMKEWKEMEERGWRIRLSRDVAATPEAYQEYIARSRGEFSCAKRSCMEFQNAWVSDRTACYLASGKPVVVQDTGPSQFLPNGEGMFRFSTPKQAANAFDSINADYERHCRAARDLAEGHFDAKKVAATILRHALGRDGPGRGRSDRPARSRAS